MAPPAGQTSNFDAPMTEVQNDFIVITIGVTTGATVALGLRMWARAGVVGHVGLDDYAVIAAWLMGIGFFICSIQWMQYGFGDHLWNVTLAQLLKYAEWSIPVVTTYCWAPMLSKFSILITYRNVNPDKLFRLGVYAMMVVIFAYSLTTTLIVSAGCRPTDPAKAQCIETLALAQGIINIVTDGLIILMPIPMIHKLQLPIGQRVVVGLVLAGGSFVIVASIVRITWIQKLPGLPDYTWEQAKVCIWSSIEIMVGIMCQCIVTLKPLAKEYVPKLIGYSGEAEVEAIVFHSVQLTEEQ
ncbi:integral membrane protein [Neofusicoccum parvum]|nr:integral membrane protein [Neofusicoccum parvum]